MDEKDVRFAYISLPVSLSLHASGFRTYFHSHMSLNRFTGPVCDCGAVWRVFWYTIYQSMMAKMHVLPQILLTIDPQ